MREMVCENELTSIIYSLHEGGHHVELGHHFSSYCDYCRSIRSFWGGWSGLSNCLGTVHRISHFYGYQFSEGADIGIAFFFDALTFIPPLPDCQKRLQWFKVSGPLQMQNHDRIDVGGQPSK